MNVHVARTGQVSQQETEESYAIFRKYLMCAFSRLFTKIPTILRTRFLQQKGPNTLVKTQSTRFRKGRIFVPESPGAARTTAF